MKEISIETMEKFTETLQMITNKVIEETGVKMILSWGICSPDGKEIVTDAIISDDLQWSEACRIVVTWTEGIAKEFPEP